MIGYHSEMQARFLDDFFDSTIPSLHKSSLDELQNYFYGFGIKSVSSGEILDLGIGY
jgi:hypothetical protein